MRQHKAGLYYNIEDSIVAENIEENNEVYARNLHFM